MALYENTFIVRQDVTAAQVEGLADHFSGIVETQGGKVLKKEHWGLRTLAYKVNKNRKGHYVLMNIDAPAAAIQELERNMRIHEDILRYLTVRVEALEEGPSAMISSKGRDRERGERDSRDGGGRYERDDRLRPTREAATGDDENDAKEY